MVNQTAIVVLGVQVHVLMSEELAKRVFKIMLLVVLCLVLLSPVAHRASLLPEPLHESLSVLNRDGKNPILSTLDLDSERSISTWFSSSALLYCSILLMTIAYSSQEGARYVRRWKLLAMIFLLLSLDEAVGYHEMISRLRSALDVGGFLYFTWVIPGAAFVLVFALAYLKFFLDLPSKSRWLFAIAGILYIWGVLGMEMISGYQADLYGRATPRYVVITTIEETSEMLGLSIFTYALMSYAASLKGGVQARPGG
jgi:hypothetical protein